MASNKTLVPEAKNGLSKFKNEVASEMGVPFTDYNGDLSSKQCGSVGGEMVKRMVQQYESKIK
ncbi:small, acid-soluble spore protein, alpha/beta type [Clostridium nigeriense]|uniref:small, acid-soluble spore protein, alpha/beta type n=1 Tax=Clostridium nigeriense TaxID=1805470 RepID=UPI003D340687